MAVGGIDRIVDPIVLGALSSHRRQREREKSETKERTPKFNINNDKGTRSSLSPSPLGFASLSFQAPLRLSSGVSSDFFPLFSISIFYF